MRHILQRALRQRIAAMPVMQQDIRLGVDAACRPCDAKASRCQQGRQSACRIAVAEAKQLARRRRLGDNRRMWLRFGHIGAILVLLLPAAGQAGSIEMSSEDYQRCSLLSKESPPAALAFSRQWLQREFTPSALHCKAVAQYAMRRYGDAARSFDQLYDRIPKDEEQLKLALLQQSAKAHWLADEREVALERLREAEKRLTGWEGREPYTKRMLVDVLTQRAGYYLEAGKQLEALQDYDHALTLETRTDSVRIARARLMVEMGQKEEAIADIEELLREHPDHYEARRALAEMVGKKN